MLENQIDQIERRAVMRNEQLVREGRVFAPNEPKEATTMHQFAQSDADTPRGRFSTVEAQVVVGATAVPNYPAASSAWQIQLPDEPPLSYAIDAMEPSLSSSGEVTGEPLSASPLSRGSSQPNPAPADAADERRDAGLGQRQFRRRV
jgi:hypothetical protein